MDGPNFYEFLQISPNAESDTIHRVYKFLAARLHPDNPETGDADKFFLLKQAYDVLSHPGRRAKYDASFDTEVPESDPLSDSIDFMDQLEGELNRRLGVLALLYIQRRKNPVHPEVSLAEIEIRMGFPRDYLEFTMWYLQKKTYITGADNAKYMLTAEGVDFVELQRANIPVLHKLLTTGSQPGSTIPPAASDQSDQPRKPIVVPHPAPPPEDRRVRTKDRRATSTDRRSK
ncbi:MAG: J domain-containing protein [Terracidiphilus sp.]